MTTYGDQDGVEDHSWRATCHDEIERIIKRHALAHGTDMAGVISASREKRNSLARHAAMIEVRATFPRMSTPRIGRIFNRDHSSVLYAIGALQRKPSWMKGSKHGVLEHTSQQTEGGGNGADEHDQDHTGADHSAG